jgi:CheY-like chemotaxis protein
MKDVLEQEERALNTMSELLHALLNIAKLESGTLQASITDVSLPSVFEDLRQQFAALAKLKKLELLVATPELHVRTDHVLLCEMLQNLLANALRYTDHGQVTLSCVPSGAGRALIEVSDTGIGIPEAVQARIFEDFFQAAARGEEHRGGAGLGLGIVRRLSSLLSIPVQVSSEVGVGTRFSIEVAVLQQVRSDAQDRGSVAAHHKGQTVLLVEDDRSMRDALRTYLKLDDHIVYAAGSLTELTDIFESLPRPPDIVISDFHLGPTERGSDAIERTRLRFKCNIPAILLTGDTSAVPARLSNEAGIRMLNKPVDAQRLVALIDELLHAERRRVSEHA